jgi:hypothetical protein
MKKMALFLLTILLPISAKSYEIATSFRLPLDGGWSVTQDFGVWNSDWSGYHLGEDVLRSSEVAVYAPANGQVKHAQPRTGYGNVVVIEHRLPDNNHVCTVMGHMRAAGLIGAGTDVTKGQLLGYLSSNPDENGGYDFTHVHFGVRQGTYVFWQYPGYGSSTEMANWYDPSDFVNDHSSDQYSCQWYTQNPNVWTWVKPGDIDNYMVQYTNTGTATWDNTGGVGNPDYVELWSCNSAGVICNSWFVPIGWINIQRVTTCDESSVAPGQRATFSFQAQIPSASSGDVRVYFRPTHGGQTMENWGGLSYNFHVDADPPTVPTGLTVTPPSNNVNSFSFSWSPSSDGQSGPEAYYWYVNSGGDNRTTGTSLPVGAYATQQGQNIFYVRCRDNVGNYSAYAQVPFTYSPGGCGPTPPWPPCSMRLDDGGEPLLVNLPSHSTQEWASGQNAETIFQPGFSYALSFWYKTASDNPFAWILGNTSMSGKTDLAETKIAHPIADSTWHWFLSVPFEVTAEQLENNPKLVLDAASANQVEVRDVQMYVAPERASKDAGSQTPAREGGR